eukprot:Lithocolla_globosa_v1_NODE_2801_length_1864_cov_5.329464.p2 type:complete len:150 gc:universal NODE_2801_length_1864_cov_5.329464:1327-878(-)
MCDFCGGVDDISNVFCEFSNCVFLRVTKVNRHFTITLHQIDKSRDKVVNILERTSLFSISVNVDGFLLQSLVDEITNHSSISSVHSWAICIKNSGHTNFHTILTVVTVCQGFRTPLAFIITRTNSDRVDIPPVIFLLRVYFRVSIHLRG